MDESATGSVNFFGPEPLSVAIWCGVASHVRLGCRIGAMHLRMPSIDQGVQAFVWAVIFFLILWLGMLAVDVSGGTALILSLVLAAAIFLLVRLRGEDRPGLS